MFDWIFKNYNQKTVDSEKKNYCYQYFFEELKFTLKDPASENPSDFKNTSFWKDYESKAILTINQLLNFQIQNENLWNQHIKGDDATHIRRAICFQIQWFFDKGYNSFASNQSASAGGVSFSDINPFKSDLKVVNSVIAELEQVSFFSRAAVIAAIKTTHKIEENPNLGDQIRLIVLDLFLNNYAATADILAQKLLQNQNFKNQIKGPQGPQGETGATGPAGPSGITNLNNIGITTNYSFNKLSSEIRINSFVKIHFFTTNNSFLNDKMFIGEVIGTYNGDDWFVGKLYNDDFTKLIGNYSITTSEIVNGGVGTDNIDWSNAVKITETELNYYTKFEIDNKLNTKLTRSDYIDALTGLILDNKINTNIARKTYVDNELNKKLDINRVINTGGASGDELQSSLISNSKLATTTDLSNQKTTLEGQINQKADNSNVYSKTETDNKLTTKSTTTALNAQKTDLESKIALKRDISDSYNRNEIDNKVAGTSGSGLDAQKLVPFQNEIHIVNDVTKSIPHFTFPSASDYTTNINYYRNTIVKYRLVVGDYFKMTFPVGWTSSRNASYNSKVSGKTFLLKLTHVDNSGYGFIIADGYENGDTSKQAVKIDFGSYTTYIFYNINNTTISTEDWAPVGNVSQTNKFIRYIDYGEQAQSKKRLAQYSRERVTIESVYAIGSGVIYTKLASALAPKTVHIDGHRMGWVRNDTPPVWSSKRLTLNAWKGWDWTALKDSGETNVIAGYTQAKRFYKGDKLNLYVDAHILTFGRQGIFLIFKDKNGTLLTISARKYQNWWLGSNEFARATNTLNCDKAAVVQYNPLKNAYFKITNFEIKFENSAIFVETQGIMDNDTDINHTISHATINYPTGFLDDGIEFVGIELNRTNWINGTNSLNGTINTNNNNNYQFKFDSQIIIKESTFNKQLDATKRGVKL